MIPSMYHRRLALLMVVLLMATGVLWGQLFRLTIVHGHELRAQAERAMLERMLLPTERGRIFDRKGRQLARDRASFDVQVEYRVITGRWAYDQARASAYRDRRETWARMSFEEREALIEQYHAPFHEQLEDLWRTLARVGGIERSELEDRKARIVDRVQRIRASTWGQWHRDRTSQLGRPVELEEVAGLIYEERSAHALLENLPDAAAFELQMLAEAAQWPGLRIERSRAREHLHNTFRVGLDRRTLPTPIRQEEPFWADVEQVTAPLIGSMRDVWAEDVQRRPFDLPGGEVDLGGYRPGDRAGATGIEAAQEDRLRGLRGQLVIHRDTQEVERQPAVVGRDVHLTIDVALQARIMAILDPAFGLTRVQAWHQNEDTPVGMDLYGSALVMEVDSGEILALVSTPVPPAPVSGEPYPDLALDPNGSLYLKPLQAQYAPGSTLKPIMYAIAATARKIEWDQHITCEGQLLPDKPDMLRCWGWRPEKDRFYKHGTLDPAEAIAHSCNIFFYTCGRRMGATALTEQLQRFGLGVPTGLGLPGEAVGVVRPLASEPNDATMVGIGQGPIAVPPIQVAAAHAALARGGYYRSPLLIRERGRDRAEHDLNLPPRVVQNVLKGMYESANNIDYGTASYIRVPDKERTFNFPGVTLRAKTGTAEAPPQYTLVRKTDEQGREVIVADRGRVLRAKADHSWYVLHVQKPGHDRASYVVVVMIEYGGSGGKVSGPITNQILYALRDEGYL
jgi:penicillin-binding protein 2